MPKIPQPKDECLSNSASNHDRSDAWRHEISEIKDTLSLSCVLKCSFVHRVSRKSSAYTFCVSAQMKYNSNSCRSQPCTRFRHTAKVVACSLPHTAISLVDIVSHGSSFTADTFSESSCCSCGLQNKKTVAAPTKQM